eukprot:GDKI01010849.1.p4 GENE.GDKI01010849.1~~GDKI01010849.1.p4  ORF type:complete len:102 (+),score=21.30 GDKI01010849.1:710-1015(+)
MQCNSAVHPATHPGEGGQAAIGDTYACTPPHHTQAASDTHDATKLRVCGTWHNTPAQKYLRAKQEMTHAHISMHIHTQAYASLRKRTIQCRSSCSPNDNTA